jgi:uncharacterized protein (DUF433 family)
MLDRAIYSFGDVDRLVGLPAGTARRWLDGYERSGSRYEPVLREHSDGSAAVTWGELVEARLLAEFRSRKVSMQRMRPAVAALRDEFGRYPLAHARPFQTVDNRELVRRMQDRLELDPDLSLVVVRNGQVVLSAAAERFQDSVHYEDDAVAHIRPSAATPDVTMDPARSFGQPTVRGIRTDAIAEDFRAGSERDELVELYDLTPTLVDQAIRFELIAARDAA